ncbi:MAG TPA: C25 family cysteine peptidase, partial [Chitinophagaceae bacterium]|nr:C25 family cysteine peptidase [Chitinophagaceae bacterium]
MKRILFLFLVLAGFAAQSQVYNNEWINYSRTYYKFKVGATGLYRINQPTLAALGIGATPAEQFQLWRNGQEIPLYTTVATGSMGGSDYIEFWGEMNDGKPDKDFYRVADFQLDDKWSLQTDTAAFFLTINPAGPNLRLQTTANNVIGNLLPIEPYFMHTAGTHWKAKINNGYAAVVGSLVYSSSYDEGEGWTSNDIGSNVTLIDNQTNLGVYTGPGAPDGSLKLNAAGNAYNPRNMQVSVNGNIIYDQPIDFYDYLKLNIPVSLAYFSSGTATINIKNATVYGADRLVIAQDILTYPHIFDFGNARNFYFELPANINGNYLEIANFNHNGTAPVLYDFTNGTRYLGDISNPALVKFKLLPSAAQRKMVLVSEDPVNVSTVSTLTVKNFVNFSLAANQGNYLIISHPALMTATGGGNPVDEYRAYRASAAGGSFNVKIYLSDELVDQFGFGIKRSALGIRNFLLWANSHFTTTPIKNVFLMGKGLIYWANRLGEQNPNIDNLSFVPTWGMPGSDNLLACAPNNEIPIMPIGRLSVINGDEIRVYLNKVKQYELVQATMSPFIADKAWMKNVGHVIGASDDNLTAVLLNYMNGYKATAIDSFYGAKVETFTKTSTDAVQQANSVRLQNLFQEGVGIVTYFGHSSATTLEYNLD